MRETVAQLAAIPELKEADLQNMQERAKCRHCDQTFQTHFGRQLHEKKMHRPPELQHGPTLFLPRIHALRGEPQCAGCHKTFAQWTGLKTHVKRGACPGNSLLLDLTRSGNGHLGSELAGSDPATPSLPASDPVLQLQHKLLGIHAERGILAAAMDGEASQLVTSCVLCGFKAQDHTKTKSHIRQAHVAEWNQAQGQAQEASAKLTAPFIKGHKCHICGFKVHDKRKHPVQCPPVFQVAFLAALHQAPKAPAEPKPPAPPSAPQSKASSPSLTAFFASTKKPAESPHGLPAGPRLANPSNYCYANSVVLASHRALRGLARGQHEALMRKLDSLTHDVAVANITEEKALQELVPHWTWDGTQQDAAEFLQHFLAADGALKSHPWQSRIFHHPQPLAEGATPLYLPIPAGPTFNLQSCVQLWHDQGALQALSSAPGDLVTVALCRYVGEDKIQSRMSQCRQVSLPFHGGDRITWHNYTIVAGVLHVGDTAQSGHYQAFYYEGGQMVLTDDAAPPFAADREARALAVQGSYLLFLRRC